MKAIKKAVSGLLCIAFLLCFAACNSKDLKSDVQGNWVIYHFYERAENGKDVFLDDTNYYSISIDEKSFSVTAKDGALNNVGGTYEWTKADEVEVIMNDGTHCTMQISENDKEHNEDAMWDIYVVETNMYYVLEIDKGAN